MGVGNTVCQASLSGPQDSYLFPYLYFIIFVSHLSSQNQGSHPSKHQPEPYLFSIGKVVASCTFKLYPSDQTMGIYSVYPPSLSQPFCLSAIAWLECVLKLIIVLVVVAVIEVIIINSLYPVHLTGLSQPLWLAYNRISKDTTKHKKIKAS